eukprot:TRINITY_DN486_c0_g1_i2.p1 TRINITY_DN486_c0_g1~~TRINITY_DN486_c0_g1_i2.p1  ORF type:complete len:554 (+),score=134.04 TRINITY_DN486_c0_g1_i2:68-1729(+)
MKYVLAISLIISSLLLSSVRADSDAPDGSTVICTKNNDLSLTCDGDIYTAGDHLDVPWTPRFYIDCAVSIGLVLLAGLVSGLTMGLMSMDKLNLKIMLGGQDEKNKRYAAKILPLIERHHLLLVTLLLTNAFAAEALPIFLDRLVHPIVAIAISVTMILMFGEIIPQAICTRYGLQIGASLSWVVWFLIALLFPLGWPISKLLDAILGKEHGTFFRRAELKELVHIHAEDIHAPFGENLTYDEVRIIKGALDMKEKSVHDCLTPADKIFAVNIDDRLDRDMLIKIVESGHHRIPVFHRTRDHFIGMILIQDLVMLNPADGTPVRNIKLYRVPIVDCGMPLYSMLHQFQTGRSHMAVVLDSKDHITPMGLLTLEDVMEELLQEDILDEEDVRIAAGEDKDILKDIRLTSALRRGSLVPGGRRPSVFTDASGMTYSGQQPPMMGSYSNRPGVSFAANTATSRRRSEAPPIMQQGARVQKAQQGGGSLTRRDVGINENTPLLSNVGINGGGGGNPTLNITPSVSSPVVPLASQPVLVPTISASSTLPPPPPPPPPQ